MCRFHERWRTCILCISVVQTTTLLVSRCRIPGLCTCCAVTSYGKVLHSSSVPQLVSKFLRLLRNPKISLPCSQDRASDTFWALCHRDPGGGGGEYVAEFFIFSQSALGGGGISFPGARTLSRRPCLSRMNPLFVSPFFLLRSMSVFYYNLHSGAQGGFSPLRFSDWDFILCTTFDIISHRLYAWYMPCPSHSLNLLPRTFYVDVM
jgi:hypothetical protein